MLALTHATSNPADRQRKLCRCGTCGIESICTPQFDFYGDAGDLLTCETCFAKRHNRGQSIPRAALADTSHRKLACPNCGKGLDAALGAERGPKPGDYGMCFYCTTFVRYVDDAGRLGLERVVVDQVDPQVRRQLQALRAVIQSRRC